MENGFLTEVLIGVIPVVIGAIAAFYFGVVQEKRKQRDQRQLEEQRQKARQSEVLIEMRGQALSVGKAINSWADRAAKLPEKMHTNTDSEDRPSFEREVEVLLQQKDNVLNAMSSLMDYYRAQEQHLEAKQRHLFDSFQTEFDSRYSRLSKHLDEMFPLADKEQLTQENQERAIEGAQRTFENSFRVMDSLTGSTGSPSINALARVGSQIMAQSMGFLLRRSLQKLERQRLEELLSGLREAAKPARDWNFQAQLRLVDAEIERLK